MAKRLRELCATLHISDELRLKIWTCFEHSLVHCTDLMVDRHLDQLLMCAIYIIAKVGFGVSEGSLSTLTGNTCWYICRDAMCLGAIIMETCHTNPLLCK